MNKKQAQALIDAIQNYAQASFEFGDGRGTSFFTSEDEKRMNLSKQAREEMARVFAETTGFVPELIPSRFISTKKSARLKPPSWKVIPLKQGDKP